eukprot:gene4514-5530_t
MALQQLYYTLTFTIAIFRAVNVGRAIKPDEAFDNSLTSKLAQPRLLVTFERNPYRSSTDDHTSSGKTQYNKEVLQDSGNIKLYGLDAERVFDIPGIQVLFVARAMRVAILEVSKRKDVGKLTTEILALRGVESVEQDSRVHALDISRPESLPWTDYMWGMEHIGITASLSEVPFLQGGRNFDSTEATEIVVAVIDSGVDYRHPAIMPTIWNNQNEILDGIDNDGNGYIDDINGYDFVNDDNNPDDDNHHGTLCSGIVATIGNSLRESAGNNYTVSIMALKILDSFGFGYISGAIQALDYALQMNAKISLHAWGGIMNSSFAMSAAIDGAVTANHVFVAAAGNQKQDTDANPQYPGAYSHPTVISVAASTSSSTLSHFSNYGETSGDAVVVSQEDLPMTDSNTGDKQSDNTTAVEYGSLGRSSGGSGWFGWYKKVYNITSAPSLNHLMVAPTSEWGQSVSSNPLSEFDALQAPANGSSAARLYCLIWEGSYAVIDFDEEKQDFSRDLYYGLSVDFVEASDDNRTVAPTEGLPADLVVAMYVVEADCGLQAQTRGTTQDNLAADSTEEGAAHQIKLLPFSDGNLDPQELPESQQINWGGGTQRVNFTARLKWAVSPFALTMDLDQLWSLVEVENGQVMSTEQDARCRGLETLVQGRVWLGYGDCTEAEQILVVAVFSKPVSALHTSHFEVGPGAWVHAVDRMPQSATSFHQNYFHVLVRFDPHFLGSTYLAVNGGAAMDAFGAPNQPSQRIKLQRLDQLSIHMHSTYKVNVNRVGGDFLDCGAINKRNRFSCYNWLVAGFNTTGRYYIDRGGEVSEGHCEQEVADGGWELLSIVQASSRASAGLFGLERCADINALHCKGNLNVLADGPPDEALAGMPDAELLIQSLDNRSVWGVFTGI